MKRWHGEMTRRSSGLFVPIALGGLVSRPGFLVVSGLGKTIPGPVATQVATQLAILTQPAGAVTGVALTTQPVIQIKDANGNLVTGSTAAVTVAVNSGTPSLSGTLTVNAVNGVATFTNLVLTGTGSVSLVFTSSGLTSAVSNSFTVQASNTWANMPSGLTVIKETNWNFSIPTGTAQTCTGDPTNPQWVNRFAQGNGIAGSGAATTTDSNAPLDNGNILQFTYGVGYGSGGSSGTAPATLDLAPGSYKHLYIGFYAMWSSGWVSNSSGVSKIWFAYCSGSNNISHKGQGSAPNIYLEDTTEFPSGTNYQQNVGNRIYLAPGTYYKHEIEWKYESSSGAGDGIIRCWINGTKQTEYTNVSGWPNDSGFATPKFSPTFGGLNDSLAASQTLNINHTILAAA